MSKGTVLKTLLSEQDKEKLLRSIHDLNPNELVAWANGDEKNFGKLIQKVAPIIKKNRKLVRKIQKEGE
jgi:hypothetical protein